VSGCRIFVIASVMEADCPQRGGHAPAESPGQHAPPPPPPPLFPLQAEPILRAHSPRGGNTPAPALRMRVLDEHDPGR